MYTYIKRNVLKIMKKHFYISSFTINKLSLFKKHVSLVLKVIISRHKVQDMSMFILNFLS